MMMFPRSNWFATVSRRYQLLAATALVAVIALSVWVRLTVVSGGTEPGRDAVAELARGGDEAVATVNGQPIPASKVRAYQILAAAGGPMADQAQPPPFTVKEFVELLIDNELLYQEAVRRGLAPSDDEVLASARNYRQMVIDGLKEDSEQARAMKDFFRQLEGTDYHYEAYDKSAVMVDAFRRQIAVGRLRLSLLETMSPTDRNDLAKREAVVADFLNGLRAASTIERLPLPK